MPAGADDAAKRSLGALIELLESRDVEDRVKAVKVILRVIHG